MRFKILSLLVVFVLYHGFSLEAQTISKKELMFLTSEWKGERFDDGRPKISDDLIERAEYIGIDDAWEVLKNEGYVNQFAGNWKMVKEGVPVIGRALTAMYMPSRPDLQKNIEKRGEKLGYKGNTNSWPIEMLTQGDVYVADSYGKIDAGTLIGATLANSIYSKSGNGVVFNGSARDLEDIIEIEGFNAFVRDFHPSFLEEMVLMGINTPIRIGKAIVMPGDLVIAQSEGVLFIPAHLAEKVIGVSEFVNLKDQFGFEMVKLGQFTAGEIDGKWSDEIKKEFLKWVDDHPESGVRITREELDKYLEK